MKLNFTLLIVSLLLVTISSGQSITRCATVEHHAFLINEGLSPANQLDQLDQAIQQWIDNNPENSSTVITIPVVFHVIYNTSAQNISDAKILAQLDVLNKDFSRTNADASNTPAVFQTLGADTEIQFCLATQDANGNPTTGIIRTSTNKSSFSLNDDIKFTSSGGANGWNSNHYLNIWTGRIMEDFGQGPEPILGYAQFPGGTGNTDGVVIYFSAVGGPNAPGTFTPYHLGRTGTHEVGHWLGLSHVWGDDGSSCSGSDQINDTPNQGPPNFNCPSFPKISCSNGPNGDMFMNYMDYTNDNCMNIFTQGQKTRMQGAINTSRSTLSFSQGCVAVGISSVDALNASISIFPNPSSGLFTLQTSFQEDTDLNVFVYNVLGEKILQAENKNLLRNKLGLDLNNYSNGIYYIVFEANGFTASRKVSISR